MSNFLDSTANQVFQDIFQEIFKAAKVPNIGLVRKAVKKALSTPVARFSNFIAQVDTNIGIGGFPFAAGKALEILCDSTISVGEEEIPLKGPLIIACNHPGTYDGFVLISRLLRDDFKLIVSGIPFFQNLPNASRYLIYSTQDTTDRMEAIRKSIAHLKVGGALIIFPSGRIDPDPAVFPDADKHLSKWSRSVEIFLKKVPRAKLVVGVVSGVLSKKYVNHPFAKLFKNDHERRRIMEFMQVINQMARGKPVKLYPKVNFSPPLALGQNKTNHLSLIVQQTAGEILRAHKELFYPLTLAR